MTSLHLDDNPLSSRGSLQYMPPGFQRHLPELTYNFSQTLSSEADHGKNSLRHQALEHLKASGSYILILLLRSLSFGFSLLDKYALGIYANGHANEFNAGSHETYTGKSNRSSGGYAGNHALNHALNHASNDASNGAAYVGADSNSDSNKIFFDISDFPDAIPSSTPRGSSPVQANVLPDTHTEKSRGDSDIFKCIFELDETDDDLVMADQYGTSLHSTSGSKYVSRDRMYNYHANANEVSAVDLLRTELSSPRDEYDDMVSKFYRPFKQAPHHNYSLTNAMLAFKPTSDFSQILKEKRGQIQQLVSRERKQAQSSIRPLSAEQLSLVNTYWASKQTNTPVVSAFSIDITARDLQTLRDSSWLNDNVIDFYLNLVSESVPSTYCWTTHFFSTLKSKGYQGVARWAKRRKVNLAEKKKVVVPINIMGTHWAVAVVDNMAKTIGYYDSLSSGGNMKTAEILRDYMIKERERLQAPSIEYTLHPCVKTPQQQNGYDCGVFTCTVARYVAGDSPLSFSQNDMKVIRRRMAYEILSKSLLDEPSQPHL